MRDISNSHYRSHTALIFQKYNILNAYDSYKLKVSVFMYEYFQNLLPSLFVCFLIQTRSDIHDYHRRNRNNFNQTRNKKKFADKTISPTIRTTKQVPPRGIQLMIKLKKKKKTTQLIIFGNPSNHY